MYFHKNYLFFLLNWNILQICSSTKIKAGIYTLALILKINPASANCGLSEVRAEKSLRNWNIFENVAYPHNSGAG